MLQGVQSRQTGSETSLTLPSSPSISALPHLWVHCCADSVESAAFISSTSVIILELTRGPGPGVVDAEVQHRWVSQCHPA